MNEGVGEQPTLDAGVRRSDHHVWEETGLECVLDLTATARHPDAIGVDEHDEDVRRARTLTHHRLESAELALEPWNAEPRRCDMHPHRDLLLIAAAPHEGSSARLVGRVLAEELDPSHASEVEPATAHERGEAVVLVRVLQQLRYRLLLPEAEIGLAANDGRTLLHPDAEQADIGVRRQ